MTHHVSAEFTIEGGNPPWSYNVMVWVEVEYEDDLGFIPGEAEVWRGTGTADEDYELVETFSDSRFLGKLYGPDLLTELQHKIETQAFTNKSYFNNAQAAKGWAA